MSKLKRIPKFKSAEAEQQFWLKHDSADYIDWPKAKAVIFPQLQPSVKTISLRLPESLLYDLKILANKEDIPYQSLIKLILIQAIKKQNLH